MDPFVHIVPDVFEFILQHLNGMDFCQITEVSKNWNEIAENSKVMMKNVKIVIDRDRCVDFGTRIVRNRRRYRNVLVNFGSTRVHPTFVTTISNYLACVGPTLHELEIKVDYESSMDVRYLGTIQLPKLQILKLNGLYEMVRNQLLSQCSSLTTLRLSNLPETAYFGTLIAAMKLFLERNRSLESLEVSRWYFNGVFLSEELLSKESYKLKQLVIENTYSMYGKGKDDEQKFLKFLARHSQSLERLNLPGCGDNVIEIIFNKMPKLESLKIQGRINAANVPLHRNENIVELSVPNIEDLDFFHLIPLLPRLKNLFIANMTKAKADVIKRHLPELQTLRFKGDQEDSSL